MGSSSQLQTETLNHP